jgi:hypothetical protein
MMKKLLLSVLFAALQVLCYGQSETVNDTIRLKTGEKRGYQSVGSPQTTHTIDQINAVENLSGSELEKVPDSLMKRLNIYVPPYYTGPGENYGKIPTNYIPENNYAYYTFTPLSNRSWLATSSELQVYPRLGANTSIGATLGYQLSDRWIITGGPYLSKYSVNMSQFNDMGLDAHLKFIAHDRIRFNVFGSYSFFGKQNGIGNYPGMYPQSSYGGAVEFKLTEKFGVETGILRQLDPLTGRWKNIPIIRPVFYVK